MRRAFLCLLLEKFTKSSNNQRTFSALLAFKMMSKGKTSRKEVRVCQVPIDAKPKYQNCCISPKQRHQRHLRHYRHRKKCARGLGNTPEMRLWISKRYASKTRLPQNDDKQTRYPHKFVYALKSESVLIHPKILTRKSESVLIHSLRQSAKNYNCITKITIRRFYGTLYWIQNSFAKGRKTVCVQN